jgi:hypothetical protein
MTTLSTKKRKVVLGLGIILLLALGAEVALRLLKIPETFYGGWLPVVYQPHPAIGYTFIPNVEAVYHRYFEWETRIKANAEGWRDYEYPHNKPAGTFRIACIGDSYTVNLEVPMEQNYPKTLERILRKRVSPAIEVLNFSVDGTGTDAHYIMFRDYALKYQPDLVIHSFHDTDIKDVQMGRLYRQGYKNMIIQYRTADELKRGQAQVDRLFYQGLAPLIHTVLRYSYLSRVVLYPLGVRWPRDYMIYANSGEPRYTPEEALEKTKQLVRQFKTLADEHQIAYMMVFLHYEDTIRQGHNPYPQMLRDVLTEQGITYLDTYDAFKQAVDKRQLYWKYDPHITEEGCRLIAEVVADFLQQNRLIGSERK